MTLGSGANELRTPRVDDRRRAEDGSRGCCRSQILPPYMRRSPKVAEVLPILYLRGPLFTGDFKDALGALLGDDASGLSPTSITRLNFLCLSTSLRRQSVIGEGLCVDRAAQKVWKEFFFLPAPVEAEHELVQVALKMFRANPVESSA